jgi:hypothetical protein
MSGERPQRGGYPAGDVTASELAERLSADTGILPSAPMTEEQVTEFRERFAAAMEQPGAHELRFLSHDPFTPDEIRALLRECVTVVRPGETLIIRTTDLAPNQMRDYQESLELWFAHNAPEIKVLVIYGEGGQVLRRDAHEVVSTRELDTGLGKQYTAQCACGLGFLALSPEGRQAAVGRHLLGPEVTHQCPPEGGGLMPCCGQTPFEVARSDRMTLDESLVTCKGRANG